MPSDFPQGLLEVQYLSGVIFTPPPSLPQKTHWASKQKPKQNRVNQIKYEFLIKFTKQT